MIVIVILFFCAGGLLFFRKNNKDSQMETEASETESRETEPKEPQMPIETKSQPSAHSHSQYLRASFDTSEIE